MKTDFIKFPRTILSSTKLTSEEKILISIILSFQFSDKTCSMSNKTLAEQVSVSEKTLERLITKLNKTIWFKSEKTSKFNDKGKWTNSKEMKINLEALTEFLECKSIPTTNQEEKVVETACNEVKQQEEETTQVEKVTEEVKSVDIRTEEQKAEAELFNSLTVQPKKEITGSFTFKNRHGEFEVSNKFLATYDFILLSDKRKNELNQKQNIHAVNNVFKYYKNRMEELDNQHLYDEINNKK